MTARGLRVRRDDRPFNARVSRARRMAAECQAPAAVASVDEADADVTALLDAELYLPASWAADRRLGQIDLRHRDRR